MNSRSSDRRNGGSTDQIVGQGRLNLFPRSRFPTELFAERSDTSTDPELIASDIEQTRYGLQQSYTAQSGAATRFRYERSSVERVRSDLAESNETDRSELLQLSVNQHFGFHGLSFESNINRVERDDSLDTTDTASTWLRHTYRPGGNFNAEDLLTYNRTEYQRAGGTLEQDFIQFYSFANWWPHEARTTRVNATLRVVGRDTAIDGETNEFDSGAGTIGVTHHLDQRSVVSASAGATTAMSNEQRIDSSFQVASYSYTSSVARLWSFDRTYFAQLDARNNDDGMDEAVQSLAAQAGYELSRNWNIGDASSLQFSTGQNAVGQSAAISGSSDGVTSEALITSASINWRRRGNNGSAMFGASLSDTRTQSHGDGESDAVFQLLNLQTSVSTRIDVHSQVTGNITLQASRTDASSTADGDWLPTASIDLSYRHRRAFGVPRLSFRSTLRFFSDSYLAGIDRIQVDNGRDDGVWDNRLDYLIGRLQLRAIARFSEIREEEQALLLLQLRRMFGDL